MLWYGAQKGDSCTVIEGKKKELENRQAAQAVRAARMYYRVTVKVRISYQQKHENPRLACSLQGWDKWIARFLLACART